MKETEKGENRMDTMKLKQWELAKCRCARYGDRTDIESSLSEEHEWIPFEGIKQVHDVLIEKGIVSDEVLENGKAGDIRDLAEYDWVYRSTFKADPGDKRYLLCCSGLDTVCDVYLNGTFLGTSESMYLPFERDITALTKEANELLLYFHRHRKMLEYYEKNMPEEFRGVVPPFAMFHKSEDYGAYNADITGYGYSPIGVFDSVTVTGTKTAFWEMPDIDVRLNEDFPSYEKASVRFSVKGKSVKAGTAGLSVSVTDCKGNLVVQTDARIQSDGAFELKAEAVLERPDLWWPRNYGEQPLYTASFRYLFDGEEEETVSRRFGVRSIQMKGDMRFFANGVPIRLWGGNIAPIYGPSNVFNEQVAFDLVDKIYAAGMNAIRVWGPSNPYPDSIYDRFDEMGILVWQDFPTGGSPLPWDDHGIALLESEARHMLRRLKHHPSIYLWCGGNENIYMNEVYETSDDRGFGVLLHNFREICEELDPSREYYVSCPYGGGYTNDPDIGDSHGSRAYRKFLPGEDYAVFFSENIRCYPPQYKSMKRWLGDEMWEEGYVDTKPFGRIKPMPDCWARLLGNNGEEKLGPVEDYYSATNAREMVYKFTAAAGQDLYNMYARARRGKPAYRASENNICQGFMVWKLNDPWPSFYCALVDYYGECALTYYAVKRAVQPVWIDLEVSDRIYLWGVNDTGEDFRGSVELTAYRMDQKRIIGRKSFPVTLLKGQSRIVTNLDDFGPLHWFTVLHACLRDENGREVLTNTAYLRKENMLPFPDAKLSLEINGDVLVVKTDDFARCVELSAGEDGEAFGWMFEDNYFDLLPFEEKRVKILKRGAGSRIRAKAQYGSETAVIRIG